MNALSLTDAALVAAAAPTPDGESAEQAVAPAILIGRPSRVGSLHRSSLLVHTSAEVAALTRDLYGREPLRRTVGGTCWRFHWRYVSGSLAGVLLRLKVGDSELSVGIAGQPIGILADVMRPELPPELRVAYLSAAGAALWRELEAIAQCVVELMDVQHSDRIDVAEDCIGFELTPDPTGPATQGFVRFRQDAGGDDGRRTLREASRRIMAGARLPTKLPVRWAAVVGGTTLTVADARTLEAGDTVLVDDAAFSDEGLNCRLVAGNASRQVGRVVLRQGKLHFVDFITKGNAAMQAAASTQTTNNDITDASTREAAFEEIQVNLRFELAQWHAPLAEVATLAAGTVIDLGRRIDEQAVSIWAEQRCLGRGQLVALGERLGVRLLTIFGSGGASKPQPAESSAPPQSGDVGVAPRSEELGSGAAVEQRV